MVEAGADPKNHPSSPRAVILVDHHGHLRHVLRATNDTVTNQIDHLLQHA
jgi:hypothetical protein